MHKINLWFHLIIRLVIFVLICVYFSSPNLKDFLQPLTNIPTVCLHYTVYCSCFCALSLPSILWPVKPPVTQTTVNINHIPALLVSFYRRYIYLCTSIPIVMCVYPPDINLSAWCNIYITDNDQYLMSSVCIQNRLHP